MKAATTFLTEALHWRYATKRMQGSSLPAGDLQTILESIRLAPSSRGLQPYKVLVIENPTLKASIQPIADHQPQITECSHLLVFAAWSHLQLQQIEAFIAFAAQERGISPEKLDKMKQMLVQDQLQMSEEAFFQWASKQAYLALAFGLVAAATLKIDATPMEGFDAAALDRLLKLEKHGLKSTALLALGYRDEEKDWLLKMKKVRRPFEELFLYPSPKPSKTNPGIQQLAGAASIRQELQGTGLPG